MKFTNVILIFSFFAATQIDASLVVTGIKEVAKGIGSQALSSTVTGASWATVIGAHSLTTDSGSIEESIKRIKDDIFHDQYTGYRPEFPYSFLRRIVNFGDIAISGGNLPWYLAKKGADLVLVNVFGKIAEQVEKRYEKDKPNYQQFFRGLDETIDWDKELKVGAHGNPSKYFTKGSEDFNDEHPWHFGARFITTATLGRLITHFLLTKVFPLITTKVPSNSMSTQFYNRLAHLFKYTDPVFYARAIKNKISTARR